ncbi:MAG: 30S ribosomal protein S6 [Desulfobacterales bacterium]|nr:MAG: 30S ribosomal protein S6 [Desulfobacterales bacterium]
MRRYETFVIVDPDISQEQRDLLLGRVKELITQMNGMLAFEDDWGERRLAYEIRKKERGHYVRFDYCGEAELVNEIERFFRIDDRALKYMTVLLDKDADLEKIKEEQAEAESKRERERAAAEMQAREEAAASSAGEEEKAAEEVEEAQEEAELEPEAPAAAADESAEETTPSEKKEEA